MKKFITLLAVIALLSGCGGMKRSYAHFTGDASKTCIDGVTYLQFTSGSTVQVDRSGKPVPC